MELQAPHPGPDGPLDGLEDRSDPWPWTDGPQWACDDDVEPPDDEFEDLPLFLDSDQLPVFYRYAALVAQLRSTVDELIKLGSDPELALADRDRLIDWTRDVEQIGNKLQVTRQVLINLMEASGCRIDGPIGLYASPQGFLSALLGIRIGEARSRVRAAQLLAPTIGMSGQRVDARYPLLAQAQATGEISADRIELLTKAISDWEKLLDHPGHNVTTETLGTAEELLAEQARVFGGRQLEQVIERVGNYLSPDGMVDDRAAQDAVRHLEIKPIGRGMYKGMCKVEGRLTAEAGAKAMAVLDPLSRPQPVLDEQGRIIESDRRDRPARMHDALEEVLDRSLRAGDLPAHGGTPTTLILTAEAEDVFAGCGSGVTEAGDKLPMDTVIALSDEAELVRTVFHKETREVLYLGRTRRLASYAQTLALAARDGGCSFPGCSKTPKWCQRHHIKDWVKGGATELPNLTLLCAFHHYRFARHGWSAEYRNGRVWWRPPKIIDPDQKPILNTRHRNNPLII